MSLSNTAMDGVSAKGVTTDGGNYSTSCDSNSSSICLGSYDWTDNHQFDSSYYKGAIQMSGNTQENLSTNINGVGTQSAFAQGSNVVGDVSTAASGATINLTNTNTATGFIGGF